MHIISDLKVLYFGTPVVLIGTRNPDGTPNIAPMSSAWWLGQSCMLGLGRSGQTTANLQRERECVLNLASSSMVDAVDRLALTTGRNPVPESKARQGYQYRPDKFAVAQLTEQAADLVQAPRIAECPIQLEARLTRTHNLGPEGDVAVAFEVEVVRTHIDESLIIPGTHHVDPVGWDPLIMKFTEFFGGGRPVHPSRLAEAWKMPHTLQPADA
jgi:flavin reductase (DIM6/NTAB) family NADH-FMN oxidoreductase RutF